MEEMGSIALGARRNEDIAPLPPATAGEPPGARASKTPRPLRRKTMQHTCWNSTDAAWLRCTAKNEELSVAGTRGGQLKFEPDICLG